MATLTVQVAASSDDAAVNQTKSVYQETDVWLVNDSSKNGASQTYTVGLRFQSVTIPQGATINAATLDIYVRAIKDDVNVDIHAEAADNAATFASTNTPEDRTRTTASVLWSATGLTDGTTDAWATSPDIASVVQEVVNRAGWTSGNSLAIICRGRIDAGIIRTLQYMSYDGNTAKAAKLNVTYTTGGGGAGLSIPVAMASYRRRRV